MPNRHTLDTVGEPFVRFRSLYPPRPRGAINPESLSRYRSFYSQYKFNDIRTLIYIFPDGHVELLTRHRVPHRFYELTPLMTENIGSLHLERGFFHILDGGVLRVPMKLPETVDRPVILWDILVHQSRYLLGTTYQWRYSLLRKLCGSPSKRETQTGRKLGFKVQGSLWLAETFRTNPEARYKAALKAEELEGIVLKNPAGKLERAVREENNGSWQIRVRKQTASYVF